MFFETAYIPSPQLSATSQDNDAIPSPLLSPCLVPLPPSDLSEESLSNEPINHIVFVIHGIGQQTEQYGHFYENIDNLRETTRQILQAKLPERNVRIELVPIEWHKHIHEEVDPILSSITLKSIPTVRLIENDYLADVLFYFSKSRGQKIVNYVTELFNTSYQNILEKYPDFNGEIVILGYSLGGIIVYDILSHQRKLTPEEEETKEDYAKLPIDFPKLNFKPTHFFGLGSPLGAVLTFRGQSPIHYHPDNDILFENVFHPFDPLAYRFEPLLNEYYTDQAAVLVERALPLGPSFSFPSMPSFPGLSLVSFIPWRLTSNPNPDPVPENSITESTERVIDESMDTSAQELPTEPSSFVSSFNAFMRYFSKEKKNMQEDEIQHPDTHVVGWDPLHEQTREQLLAFCDDLNIHLKDNSLERDDRCNDPHHTNENLVQTNNSHNNHNHRPCLKLSKTSASPRDIRIITDSPITHFAHSFISPLTSPIESKPSDSLYSASFRHENRHHLVEVLGIDGIRMDTVERARINFDRYSHQRQEKRKSSSGGGMDTLTIPTAHKEKQGDSGSNAPKDLSSEPKSDHSHSTEVAKEPHQNKNKNNSHSSSQEKTSQRNEKEEKEEKDSGNNTLLTDLNKELHAPGPAITSPGKSKEDAAKDATLTKDSTKEEQEEQEQGEEKKNKEEDSKEKEAKQQEALNTLPRAQRIDYVLQPESFMSMIANEYLVGMRAHFSYWTNKDLLWHIVRRLEKLDGVSKEETQTPSVSSSTRTDSNNRRA